MWSDDDILILGTAAIIFKKGGRGNTFPSEI
jgi:hypothetical protein